MNTKYFSKTLKGRDHLEDAGVGGRMALTGALCTWDSFG